MADENHGGDLLRKWSVPAEKMPIGEAEHAMLRLQGADSRSEVGKVVLNFLKDLQICRGNVMLFFPGQDRDGEIKRRVVSDEAAGQAWQGLSDVERLAFEGEMDGLLAGEERVPGSSRFVGSVDDLGDKPVARKLIGDMGAGNMRVTRMAVGRRAGDEVGYVCMFGVDTDRFQPVQEEVGKVVRAATHEANVIYSRREGEIDQRSGLNKEKAWKLAMSKMLQRHPEKVLCVVACDINDFRGFNNYSHAIGDEVIRLVGETTRGNIREGEGRGARKGDRSDEILMGVFLDNMAEAGAFLGRMGNRFSDLSVETSGGPVEIGVSMGAAIYPPEARVVLEGADPGQADEFLERVMDHADRLEVEVKQTDKGNKLLVEVAGRAGRIQVDFARPAEAVAKLAGVGEV